jgi:predicted phosphoribosyltransferase
VPVACRHLPRIAPEVDDLRASAPERSCAIGLHYDDFHQLDDAEVMQALAAAEQRWRGEGTVGST